MEPVAGLAGDDVILPCNLLPAESVAVDTVEWTRSDLDPSFVYVFRKGQELYDLQNPAFQQRTFLFLPELKKGNMSLKLSRIQLSDQGIYTCKFIRSSPYTEILIPVLLVVGAVSEPTISVVSTKGASGVLQCEAKNWFPKPEIEWTDSEGQIIPHESNYTVQYDEYYTVNSSITVNMEANNSYTCTVHQKNISQSRKTKHVLSGVYKEVISLKHLENALIAILVLMGVIILLSSVYAWRVKCQWFTGATKNDKTDRPEGNPLLSQLQEENERLKEENERLKEENERLKVENERLKVELEKLQNENEALKRPTGSSPALTND